MQTDARPTDGLGQFAGDASVRLEPVLNPPRTLVTVWLTRALVRQPLPLAALTCVVPEHAPPAVPKGLSYGSALATACLAPCRAASATVVVAQSTRNRSMVRASRKKRTGNISANSTSAWPLLNRGGDSCPPPRTHPSPRPRWEALGRCTRGGRPE